MVRIRGNMIRLADGTFFRFGATLSAAREPRPEEMALRWE